MQAAMEGKPGESLSLSEASVVPLSDSVFEKERILANQLRHAMDEHIVAQDEAKETLISVLIQGMFNVFREQGVLGSVFLWGPTGVGKTELARTLARVFFGDPNAFVKIPCETMPHECDIARLVGASSGYIGYGDVPFMADVRVHAGYKAAKQKGTLHPLLGRYEMENFSIVLVDELEKAHPDIANAFLNALQSGEMSMSSGKELANSRLSKDITHALSTDLRNTLFIFTSNVGEHVIATEKRGAIGFSADTAGKKADSGDRATFEKALKKAFAPEFLHRIDAIVRCHSITGEHLRQIMALNVGHVNRALRDKGYFDSIRFEMSPEFVEHSLKSAKSEEAGARAISVVMKGITARLGMALQSGKLPDEANGIIRFELLNGNPDINFYETPGFIDEAGISKRTLRPTSHSSESVRNFVEGKLSAFGDTIREVIAEYMELMSDYDPDYKPAKKFLEGRLEACGFTAEDLGFLQTSAFLRVYETTERLAEGEVIIRDGADFEPVGFRAIEKYLRASVAKNVPLARMYAFIRVLLDRPMSRNEAIVVSQHLHRLLQGKGH